MLESWYISYHVFKEWAISQGYKDGDKIMVKKGAACLSPDTVMVVPNIYTRARIEPPIGLSKVTIHKRIHKLGWSVEKALSTPSRVRKKK